MKIVLCGGHLTPALALIDCLKNKNGIEIIFFGRKSVTEGTKNYSSEYLELAKSNVTFVSITTGRLQRKFTKYTIPSLLKIPIGFLESLYYLAKHRPNLIVSFGSYHSVPIVFAGWLLGIDTISQDQATIPGLSTKINSLFSKKIFLTWRESLEYFASAKSEVVGNLIRESIFKKTPSDLKINKFLNTNNKLIYITGGNQGSHFLNKITFEILPKLANTKIIHQVGSTNFEGDLDKAKKIKNVNYLALSYIESQNIGGILQKADLVIGRSGANTVWELATLAKVAILIPLPHSASGEQNKNAKILERAGSAIIISQDQATPKRIISEIKEIFKNYSIYQKNAKAFSKKIPKNAADKITSFILKYLHVQTS